MRHKTGIQSVKLKCDFREYSTGVGTNPTFSWKLLSGKRNQFQSAYHLIISDNRKDIRKNKGNIFDSQKVNSDQSIHVRFENLHPEPGEKYIWKVKVWDQDGNESGWSPAAEFITALFEIADWHGAQWIAHEEMNDSLALVPGIHIWGNDITGMALLRPIIPMFRKEFNVAGNISSAFLFVSGLGHYQAFINGQPVSEDFLSPGWTNYRKTCQYNTYDITDMIHKGNNTAGFIAGNGFYNVNNERYRKLVIAYGMPGIIAQIRIKYTDGTVENIVTGPGWKSAPSPITYSSIYGGEDYDARLEQPGWDQAGFDDSDWQNALPGKDPGGKLVPETTCPVKIMEEFEPAEIIQMGIDTFLYDFGQNASGIFRLKVRGKKGDKIRLVPGELISENKSVNQRASGRPHYYEYTLKGTGEETWQPAFSYYGFRYIQVEGAVPSGFPVSPGQTVITKLSHLHTYNSAPRTGSFNCSSELFNRIYKLILYAIQSNMQSVVTDCPHREKLGWLEQTYLMGGSIQYNIEVYHLYRKLINDMMDSQRENGLIPSIAPEYVVFGDDFTDSPEWGSAMVILPWLIYKWYGDISTMEKAWPAMLKYVEYLGTRADDHILSHGLGDWYDLGSDRPGYAQLTPKELTATAIYYYDVFLLSEMAGILNLKEKEISLREKADKIKDAFNTRFYDQSTMVYSTGSQTAMAMPLCLGIVEYKDRPGVFQNLVDSIMAGNKALTSGDIGFHFLVEALTKGGASQLLFDMNNRDDVPGYGYQLKKGATALTESWDALETSSNNHLMLGHIMEWFYQGPGGISQNDNSVAYKDIIIKPSIVEGLTNVHTEYCTPYGYVKSEWENNSKTTEITVEIPVNTTATIILPATDPYMVTESGKKLTKVQDIQLDITSRDNVAVKTGSGIYRFEISESLPVVVPDSVMQSVFEEIRTPYKYGLVLVPENSSLKIDCPTVFHRNKKWYMTYLVYNGRGYETWLAESNNLLDWQTSGRIMSFSDSTDWDDDQKAGYISLIDWNWEGTYEVQRFNGKYWMSYFGGSSTGYERGLLSIGMAFTDKDPASVHEWQRLDKPVLMSTDPDVRWWENSTMYKSHVIRDKSETIGYPFIMYYNARGDSINPRRGAERIGMAVSDDMMNWKRYRNDPVIDHHTGISGDPVIQKIHDVWVMFYFGAFWPGRNDAFNRFACSYDLVNWTDWKGEDLIAPSEPYDDLFAHKSFVVKHKGVIYHFYCAVNKNNDRGIAVATSKDPGAVSKIDFNKEP